MDHAPLSDLLKEDPQGLTSDPAFLAGGGEMGERIRSFDWGGTSIGPIESWSPALQSAVSIMLANRFPMLLWWGPQFLSIYNDAYAPILGAKHPTALGLPVTECWSEIWHILKPLIETPFQGGPSTWIEDLMMEVNRHGFAEEGHWTVAYSPVPDGTAPRGIGGVLATVHEITEKVIAERRVAAMRDLGTKATEAKTAEDVCTISAEILAMYAKDIPFALLYLIDSERKLARLTATAGVRAHLRMSPPIIDLAAQTDDPQPWPLIEVMHTEEMKVVDNLTDEFGTEAPAGTWFDPPRQAVVVPIRSNTVHQLAGFLVAGVSIRLQLDEPYRNFYQFVAGQIATAIANARAYEEERKRADALAELDRTKTAFFSNVSHELRTPLTLMLGPLEELKAQFGCSRSSLGASQYRQVDVVHRNGLRLLKLVNQLLDFACIEAGRAQALYEETDLAAFTADLASVFRSAIEKAGLSLIVDCPPLPEPVFVDRDMWEKIVLNLLSNAFKFTFSGEIEVSLGTEDSGLRTETSEAMALDPNTQHSALTRSVTLCVRDTGIGIQEDQLGKIFERFHRVPGSQGRPYEGTGIGLSLVQELARLHGGSVSVESRYGKGSTFRVFIPLGKSHLPHKHIGVAHDKTSTAVTALSFVEEAARWLPSEGSSECAVLSAELRSEQPLSPNHSGLSTHDSALSKTRPRILLADDNADMREYAHRLLSAQGYEVESVADGQAALDCVQANPPDIVLTDVMMPRLDGFGLLQALRADERTRTLPIIMLSARAGEEARVAGLRAGTDDYLVKPFSARELLARVRSQLELARLRRENEERVSGILSSITDGFQTIGADYRFKYFNEAARRTYIEQGMNPDEQIGRHIFDEVFPAERDKPWAVSLCRTMSKRIPTQAEIFHEPWQRWFAARFDPAPDGGISVFFQDITERKQAEKALRESEERQAFLLALSDALRPLTAPADIAGLAAERLGERFGLNRVFYAEIAGSRMTVERDYARNVGSIVGEHNLEDFDTAMLAAYRDGAVITVNDVGAEPRLNEEARVGLRLRQVGAYVDVVLFEEEQKVGLLALQSATSRDWTAAEQNLFHEVGERVKSAVERARAEEALRQSERETKRARDYAEATLRTSPIPLLVLEKDLRVNTANVAFYQTFQANPAETEGRLVYELGNGQWNIPKLRELLENILPQHTVFRGFEVTHDFESIGRRTMLLNARRMDNEPDIPERIVLVIEDITDRKQSEEAKARLAAIVASSDDAIISKNLQGIITSWNKGAEKIFGYAAAETIGRSIMMLIPPQRVDEEPKILASINRGETVAHYETVRRRKDGTDVDISLTISPVRDETGNIIGASKIARDISERKRAEEALRRLNDELEQRVTHRTRDLVQSQDRLRAMATELNLAEQRERKRLATELHDHLQQTLVLGRLLVGQGKREAAPVPACLDVMKKMDDIFSEALTYTRTLVADLSPPVLRDHGLPAGLKWLGEYMKKHEITVTVTVPETDVLKLPEDQAVLLFQSVRELLINSSKHAGTKQADIRMERYDGQLRIEVSDQGVGFDLAAAAAAAAAAGTPNGGISSKFGLFSIQERMRALGGTFEVQSAPGQGTTATLSLPMARSTDAKVLSAELSGESSALKSQDSALPGCSVLSTQDSAHQQHAEIRVLLVDDHPMMRQGLRTIVTAYEHFEVVGEAGDGAEAVELAQRLNPDVVVMDIDMPKMEGIEATQQIKANQPATVVIGLSVNRSADTEQKMKEAGASAYLTKESAVDALCHAIEQAVSSTQHVASAGPTSSHISLSDRSGTVTGT